MKNLLTLCLVLLATLTFLPVEANGKSSLFNDSSANLFSNDDEFLQVDDAFIFNFYQNGSQLQINFDIAEGYYLYRHQFKFQSKNAVLTEAVLPEGIDHEDDFFGVQKVFTEPLAFILNIEQASNGDSVKITYQGCAEKGLCYPPTSKIVQLMKVDDTVIASTNAHLINKTQNTRSLSEQASASKSEQHQLSDMLKQESLLLTLIAFFVGGLLLSFTPCVFPMYPILTSVIVGQGKQSTPLTTKKAFTLSFIYVQGMAITYTLLGIVVALAGAKFQAAFQHPIVLISLSVLFIFLALSMFGVFNLALPVRWQNKLYNISNQQEGGSINGVLMMGVISGLVASPCTTAPLTGALLYISQTGDMVLGASALYALSLGMGLPLLILGSSGGKLLPKAGAWMNTIKNIFGLLLLAVPIFLLERFIPEVASQALWALLLLASASYFYVANENHTAKQKSQVQGFWYGLRSLVIFLMLFFGANLTYQLVFASHNAVTNNTQHPSFKKVTSLTQLNSDIAIANKQGKTVMVDLYADWCIACKEFDKYTFADKQVQQALSNTVWLQVDMTEFDSKNNHELVQHYNILGLPSILFFDLQGNELAKQRTTGFMNATEFVTHIEAIF